MQFLDLNKNIKNGDLALLKQLEIKEDSEGINILCSDSKGKIISINFPNYYKFMVRKEVVANWELDNNKEVFTKTDKSWFIDLSSNTLNFTYKKPIHYQIFCEFEVVDILAGCEPEIKIL